MSTLQIDVNRGFRLWLESELYDGNNNGYLPNKDDLILNYGAGLLRVTNVNYTNKTYDTIPWSIPNSVGVDSEDIILGAGPGRVSESFRIYIDDSIYPHAMVVDGRFRLWGSDIKNYKIFKGSDISESGNALTRNIDANLEVADTFIGVDPVSTSESGTVTAYRPKLAHCIERISTGELLTLVAYNDFGSVVSTTRMLAERTGFVRQTNQNTKYITGIRIISPYLDQESATLRVPVNMSLQSIAMQAAIKYSDGKEVILPIDGSKVRLDGMNTYVSTVVGQSVRLVLKYYLGDDEVNYSTLNGSSKHIARVYTMRSINVDGAHTVKLLTYPTWNSSAGNWDLRHWLINLDRNISRDVTNHVRLTQTSNTFNPSRYGVTQELAFVLNLRDVSPIFNDYQHVQTVNVNLLSGPSPQTPWTVEFTPGQQPPYGWDLFADFEFQEANLWKLKINSGHESFQNWLTEIYRQQEPMYDPDREIRAPDPTHFRLVFKNGSIEYELFQFNQELIVPNDLTDGETLFIQFYQKLAETDLHLGVAGIPVRIT